MAISVNMLRWPVTSERTPRSKIGQPAQSTTGVASANCSQWLAEIPIQRSRGTPTIGSIASKKTGSVSAAAIQNRRLMRRSSGSSSPVPACTVFGSRSMPHFGQAPGPICSISGCIGQV